MNNNGTMKSVQRMYDRLSPDERFLAVIAAYSRGDDLEIQNLVHSCPRRTYTGPESEYRLRLIAARELTDLIVFEVLSKAAGGYLGFNLGFERDDFEAVEFGSKWLLTAAAAWAGFRLFCQDIGADFEGFTSVSTWGRNRTIKGQRASAIFEMYTKLAARFEPDPALVEEQRAACHNFWKWATGPDSPLF